MDDFAFWILISVGIVVGALAAIFVVGLFLPSAHQVARSLTLKQTPDAVWQVITDFANVPRWHLEVIKVERGADKNGHELWKETYRGDYGLLLETTESTAPTRLVRSITDESGPFTGRWEFALDAIDGGCRLTITEFGEVKNPFFRVMFRLFMKPDAYLLMYLQALAAKFAQPTDAAR